MSGEIFATLLVIAMAALAAWAVLQSRFVFVVRIANGEPRLAKGKVTTAFLSQIREACHQYGIKRGCVRGVARGGRISLVFSRDVPSSCRQQLRNWWGMSGW
jgi:hypothetical protein